jgi:hypothetical protein
MSGGRAAGFWRGMIMPGYDGYVLAAYAISLLGLGAAVLFVWTKYVRARRTGKDLETKN